MDRCVYSIDRIGALPHGFETRENTNRNLHGQNAVVFPKRRTSDDNPAYYFASFLSLRFVGSGSESSDGPAASGHAGSADFNPGRCCTDGCSGLACDSAADSDWTSDTNHDEGSRAGRADYAAGADARDECANHPDHGQSWTTRGAGNAGEWNDVRARASRYNAESIECKCGLIDR